MATKVTEGVPQSREENEELPIIQSPGYCKFLMLAQTVIKLWANIKLVINKFFCGIYWLKGCILFHTYLERRPKILEIFLEWEFLPIHFFNQRFPRKFTKIRKRALITS